MEQKFCSTCNKPAHYKLQSGRTARFVIKNYSKDGVGVLICEVCRRKEKALFNKAHNRYQRKPKNQFDRIINAMNNYFKRKVGK